VTIYPIHIGCGLVLVVLVRYPAVDSQKYYQEKKYVEMEKNFWLFFVKSTADDLLFWAFLE